MNIRQDIINNALEIYESNIEKPKQLKSDFGIVILYRCELDIMERTIHRFTCETKEKSNKISITYNPYTSIIYLKGTDEDILKIVMQKHFKRDLPIIKHGTHYRRRFKITLKKYIEFTDTIKKLYPNEQFEKIAFLKGVDFYQFTNQMVKNDMINKPVYRTQGIKLLGTYNGYTFGFLYKKDKLQIKTVGSFCTEWMETYLHYNDYTIDNVKKYNKNHNRTFTLLITQEGFINFVKSFKIRALDNQDERFFNIQEVNNLSAYIKF